MTMLTVPLQGGSANAHQIITVSLGDNLLELHLSYVTLWEQWSMDVYREGVLLAAGAMLEPNANVVEHYRLDIGQLVFVGKDATLDNLGIENKLVWVSPDDG